MLWIRLVILGSALIAWASVGAAFGGEWSGVAFAQRAPDGIGAWYVLPTKLVFDEVRLPHPAEPESFLLKAARDEYECWQLVVRPAAAVSDVCVRFSDLVGQMGRIRSGNCRANKVGPVAVNANAGRDAVRRSGGVPDALLTDAVFALEGGRNNVIWLTVRTPRDARPGLYRGKVRLCRGDSLILELPVALRVWDFAVPDETSLVVMANVWTSKEWFRRYTAAPLWDCLRPYYDNLKDHRIRCAVSSSRPQRRRTRPD